MDRFLVILEVSQKQRYIFSSNKLAQNVGASIMIREITEVIPKKSEHLAPDDIFFLGGGKSVFDFSDEEKAHLFISQVSECAIRDYPGVEVFMAFYAYDSEKENNMDAVNVLYSKLEEKKSIRRTSFGIYGLGITENSKSTNMPVKAGTDGLSAEEEGKRKAAEKQDKEYEKLLPADSGFLFPMQFEDLGVTKDQKSYLAVIVMDGNRMGRKIAHFRDYAEKKMFRNDMRPEERSAANELYKKEFGKLSEKIDNVYSSAIRDANAELICHLDDLYSKKILSDVRKGDKRYLPCRPLIAAGDDICIVCDARIALYYTELLLRYVKEESRELLKDVLPDDDTGYQFDMKACAGIVMMPSHYPFFRAHELAEELASNAKKQLKDSDDSDACVIDFHIVQGEIEGSLNEIRRTKYDSGRMTMRPYYVDIPDRFTPEEIRNTHKLDDLKNCVRQFRKSHISRSTLKGFRDALTKGEQAMRSYRNYKKLDKTLGVYSRGLAFDAIEVMDIFYIPEESKK